MSGDGGTTTTPPSEAGSTNSIVLVATKTFKWNLFCERRGGSTSIEIPVEDAGSEIPSSTLKLSVMYEHLSGGAQEWWKLSYNCYPRRGENRPMFEARISVSCNSHTRTIHESDMMETGGYCKIPNEYIGRSITLKISLDFFCNRSRSRGSDSQNAAALNFPGDTWNKHHKHATKKQFVDMLESGELSDVKIISNDGQEFNAHKFILTTKNEVFEAMFQLQHDAKVPTTSTGAGVIKFDDMSGRAVKFLLHFIYSTEILKISADKDEDYNERGSCDVKIEEVLHLADKFGLIELTSYLNRKIGRFCVKENAWHLFKLCKRYSLQRGRKAVFEFMQRNNAEFIEEIMWSQA